MHDFNEQINDLERTLITLTPFIRFLRMGEGQDILLCLLQEFSAKDNVIIK